MDDLPSRLLAAFIFVVLQITSNDVTAAGCNIVRITGTKHVHQAVGNYEAIQNSTARRCADSARNVYQQIGGSLYLSYVTDSWVVGPQYCYDTVKIMTVKDPAALPEDIESTWHEVFANDSSVTGDDVNVACGDGFKGCAKLVLKNAYNITSTEGTYEVMTDMFNGRHIYQKSPPAEGYHILSIGGYWAVAIDMANNNSILLMARVFHGAFYPESIDTVWETYVNDAWIKSAMIVECKGRSGLSTGPLIGVIIASLLAVAGIVFVAVCLGKWQRARLGHPPAETKTKSAAPRTVGMDNLAADLTDLHSTDRHTNKNDVINNNASASNPSSPSNESAEWSPKTYDIDNAIMKVQNIKNFHKEFEPQEKH